MKVIVFNNYSDIDFTFNGLSYERAFNVSASNFDFEKAKTGAVCFHEAMLT